MRILAIDIGAGTQDILFVDTEKNIHNAIKMIFPSPTKVYAKKISRITEKGKDLFIRGKTIGGGAITRAIKRHLSAGYKVYMTKEAAFTIRNKLDEVKALGIEIVQDSFGRDFKGEKIDIHEVWIDTVATIFESLEETIEDIDCVAVAVQDHGKAPSNTSDRKFRIETVKQLLSKHSAPWQLAFLEDEVPSYCLRMQSIVSEIQKQLPQAKVLVMDTSAAAILGALQDEAIKDKECVIASDIGNGHTMVAVIKNGEIQALAEHHTAMLNKTKLKELFTGLADGTVSNEKVFNDGGHGALYLSSPVGFENIESIIITGPNRELAQDLDLPIYFAAPAGDVMITGPIGLIIAAKKRLR